MSEKRIIALDVMGGDNAPHIPLQGAEKAAHEDSGIKFLLFGDKAKIEPELARMKTLAAISEIVHTEEVVAPHEKPSQALKKAANSSMRLAINAVAEGRASSAVSAGNTGALMAISKFVLRTIPGIDRPAIASVVPTLKGGAVFMDLGANIDCDADNLLQFALMGEGFAKAVLGLKNPSIGLLNVGSEDEKGSDVVKAAAQAIKNLPFEVNFHGFVEGDDIFKGTVDVVVTDGFTGNVALKTAEGVYRVASSMLKDAFAASMLAKVGYLLARPALHKVKSRLDPKKRGGAMFLGLNGIVVKSHGNADADTIASAVLIARDIAAYDLNSKIKEEMKMVAPANDKARLGAL